MKSAGANAFTERLLIDAGIEPGMHVLDVGCGRGDVAFLLAELVGSEGRVTGIDRDSAAINTAQDQAFLNSVSNIRFDRMDLTDSLPQFGELDAIVGRRVLMYLPEPSEVVARLVSFLRPGGVAVFQEHDMTMKPACLESLPLHEQVQEWIRSTVEAEGGDTSIGFRLPSILTRAGLETEHVRAEAMIQGQGANHPLATIVRFMVPRIVEQEIATEEEIDVGTLEQRLAEERPDSDVVFVSDMAFGAWARSAP